ncbi:MAG TPA: hypothetical protein VLH94_00955 [Spirochaetia bacterium]|nr:hypothetical protein [Spirochaetia bacterium]
MFWLIGLPLIVSLIYLAGMVITKQISFNVKNTIGNSILIVFVCLILGFFINIFGANSDSRSYPDLDKKIFLAQVPNIPNNIYLISIDDLQNGKTYHYYFTNSNGVLEKSTILFSEVRIVEDNPPQPYLNEVKYTCVINKFWLLWCTSHSPYSFEVHIPPNSILNY